MAKKDRPITPTQLTIQQVADILQCEHKSVRAMISRGELKAYRYGPRMIRIDPADLEKLRKPVTKINEILGDAA